MKKHYEAPQIEVLDVEIEKGFATSGDGDLQNPLDGGNWGW